MTQDDIILMAQQAYDRCAHIPNLKIPKEFIETFAKLVAAKERDGLCKYFQELEDKAPTVRDKMYLSGVQFVIKQRSQT